MDEKRNATKAAVVLKIAHGGKYEFAGRVLPEGTGATAQSTPAEQPKK